MILVSYLVPTYTGFYSNTTLKAFFTRSHIHPFTHIIIKFLLCTLNYFFLSCYHMHTWTPVDGVWFLGQGHHDMHMKALRIKLAALFDWWTTPSTSSATFFLPGCPCFHLSFYYQMCFVRSVCYFRYLFFTHLDL